MFLEKSKSQYIFKGVNMTNNKDSEKNRIRSRYKGVDRSVLECIPAAAREKFHEDTSVKRVAVYARVSTDDAKQTSSYELQRNHYHDMVKNHQGWTLVGIYADEGISGTSMQHRDSFNRMIADCKEGKIDLVVTKSISRFARNIVDCIATIRELAALPNRVGIYFETEAIFTLDNTTEMMLAVLSAAAQEESHTKSEIMNISIEQRFSRGIFLVPALLGYDKDENDSLVINQEEAETVKVCFYLYLGGYSGKEIAEILNKHERKTKLGNIKWTAHTVVAILKNERYCGDILSRKTFTPNYLDHKSRKNNRDRNQYWHRNHHEAIIPRVVFEAVNKLIVNYKCAKAGKQMPVIKVISQGSLLGFVPVDRLWYGFFLDDYVNASSSIKDSNFNIDRRRARRRARYPGYQIVRQQFFSLLEKPTLYFSDGKLSFSTNCLKRFRNVEYVELLFNPVENKIAIRPCTPSNPNAIKWGRFDKGRWLTTAKSCKGFSSPLFEKMAWEPGERYRISGQYINNAGQQLLVFNLNNHEKMVKIGRAKYKIAVPEDAQNCFGVNYCEYIEEQEHWKNKQDFYDVAETVTSMNGLTDDEIKAYKLQGLELITKWKEYKDHD